MYIYISENERTVKAAALLEEGDLAGMRKLKSQHIVGLFCHSSRSLLTLVQAWASSWLSQKKIL